MKNKKILHKKISNKMCISVALLLAILIGVVFYLKSKTNASLFISKTKQQTQNKGINNTFPSNDRNKTFPVDTTAPFQYSDKVGFYGTLTLSGYLDVNQRTCKPGDMCTKTVNYASFVITNTDNKLIYDFINNYKGNSYVGVNSIGLGCYEKNSQNIHSVNFGDDGKVENNITNNDLQKLLRSNKNNTVNIQITKPTAEKVGSDATDCYSHFRSFIVLQ